MLTTNFIIHELAFGLWPTGVSGLWVRPQTKTINYFLYLKFEAVESVFSRIKRKTLPSEMWQKERKKGCLLSLFYTCLSHVKKNSKKVGFHGYFLFSKRKKLCIITFCDYLFSNLKHSKLEPCHKCASNSMAVRVRLREKKNKLRFSILIRDSFTSYF